MTAQPPLPRIPADLREKILGVVGPEQLARIFKWLRPAEVCMNSAILGTYKSSRVSFIRLLARQMISEKWRIERKYFESDEEGDARGRYDITLGGHKITYILRGFRWDGKEKVGRRSDGANRDMLGAMFVGVPSEERIAKEFATFDTRDADTMRTDGTVAGWNPANRSARFFDYTVDTLTAGQQPDPRVIGEGGGYLVRNGGFIGSGRYGTLSYGGYPDDHPFRHPYFADLFGIYLIRQSSIDLVNAIAKRRNPNAAQLSPEIARFLGVGNSSGQGMCVAMQRWPHWIATWVLARELALAYAKSMRIDADWAVVDHLCQLIERAVRYYRVIKLQSESYVVPLSVIADNLDSIRKSIGDMRTRKGADFAFWGEFVEAMADKYDPETLEQFGSFLIEIYPSFADLVGDYIPMGSSRVRDVSPEMSVGELKSLIDSRYAWIRDIDMKQPGSRQHFWYHSADNGEQRRGERDIDPHVHFESFIDHIGAIQRLSEALESYDKQTAVAEVIADAPELAYATSRVQYLVDVPYAEFQENLIDQSFIPARLIRFMLAAIGIEASNPLSVQYVRGVFFQGMPLPDDIIRGASDDWVFPTCPNVDTQ